MALARTVWEVGETMMEDVPHAETPLKVLVVDDQADSADAVAFMLSLMGHDVHTAYGPREALDKFRQVRPTVVFMDISMPELSGLEAAARIRSMPEGTSTTIIALTGLGHEADRRRSREALDKFRQVRPTVVFMDISMPELSGLEAAARIRSMPEGTSTTIIALTGLGHEADRRRSREASIDHHLVKPASPMVLHRLLSAIHPI